MIHRSTARLTAVAICALFSALWTGSAEARVRAAADVATTLPLGSTERNAQPAFTGLVKLQWISPYEKLIVGLVGGRQMQDFRATSDPSLSATLVGGEVAGIFGPQDWGTRPYLGFQAGIASLTVTGDAEFNRPSGKKTSSGFFVMPEAGLLVALTPSFGLRFDFRYSYIHSGNELAIGNVRTYASHSMGIGAGLMLTF
jgi:hypothetical protein